MSEQRIDTLNAGGKCAYKIASVSIGLFSTPKFIAVGCFVGGIVLIWHALRACKIPLVKNKTSFEDRLFSLLSYWIGLFVSFGGVIFQALLLH